MGGRVACDEVTVTAQLTFRNVTLGYDRHPAVHHLNGEVTSGALIPVLGFSALYFVDTCTLFATLWAVIGLPAMPIEGSAGTAPGLRAVLDGFVYLRGHPLLLMSFVVDLIAG